jgi:hypothetical protein
MGFFINLNFILLKEIFNFQIILWEKLIFLINLILNNLNLFYYNNFIYFFHYFNQFMNNSIKFQYYLNHLKFYFYDSTNFTIILLLKFFFYFIHFDATIKVSIQLLNNFYFKNIFNDFYLNLLFLTDSNSDLNPHKPNFTSPINSFYWEFFLTLRF